MGDIGRYRGDTSWNSSVLLMKTRVTRKRGTLVRVRGRVRVRVRVRARVRVRVRTRVRVRISARVRVRARVWVIGLEV